MYDNTDHSKSSTEDTLNRLGNWLKSRPIENWGFFIAGVIIARILF
ncbi:hypothetical protein [Hirschia baltica]|uniref:Uncharacterized protein n=1 Tax=Hirschia baltica (strain ATCC 49814 / DSM 5838 / IFAM 1418) TaxID=582402 RepID=C6XR64_HIRBI|nr:hypothetical protein [Hirschia baltica]ACT60595.1 hypothetical protein Hbal_2926 [Hirschia baltica ATCC 49814]